ncbi:hypothetical protein AVV36_gp091 [Pectobacterium bacteriophage PM2]|uniref:Thioredoxin n=1 Tax=Pectobacterium bacteriophage PM2 TaxID=1429794 RepID=A0A0A0Q0L3_9CAUD|nr:hypothetical protein AVV36_gp091 [Pectobacterium bacteriophage PM2]AHY25053.1 hypothetical protein PM2_091 [Pectobacterium bacteriophage PM2]
MKMQLAEDIDTSWKAMMLMVERRENAARQVQPCPKCSDIQVQLVDWSTDELKMKCRICKHKFTRTLNETA